jgi:hypothetical protein
MKTLNGACQSDNGLAQVASITYKAIEFPFRKNGFEHELLERRGLTCLVQRTSVAYGHSHFEVVKLQERGYVRFDNGRELQPAELYPASSKWGECGWTYRTLDEARKRFATLAPTKPMVKQPLSTYSPPIKTAGRLEADAGLGQYELNFAA